MGGFFGVVSRAECATDLFYGTDYQSHLGTKRAGLATYGREQGFVRSIHNIESSYFRTKFESELGDFRGTQGIGVISDTDPQPILVHNHLGRFAIVTVGKIANIETLREQLLSDGLHFSVQGTAGNNPTEIVAALIGKGATFAEGIAHAFDKIQGSCSLLLLTEQGIIAARDKWGRTPVVMAEKGDGGYAVTSETCSLPNLGYTPLRDLGPSEVVEITTEGCKTLVPAGKQSQVCAFLWVYYGFPNSCYEGVNVEAVRHHLGMQMGKDDGETELDGVCGIPDSGVGMAYGYSNARRLPYLRAIAKYTPTWPRSFMPATQAQRSLIAKMKLIPNKAMLAGKRMAFCDDSIVRGTQLRDQVKMLFGYGAKEVHIRISCPPLIYACPFINFTTSRSADELIARRVVCDLEGGEPKDFGKYAQTGSPCYCKMVEEIRKRLGLTSLKFSKIETIVEAIGLPKEKICTHCFDGSSHF